MALSTGTRLGPYEITSPLGAGGMGEVYKAKDTRLDRLVAIKVLPSHVADDPEARRRFEREARTVSSLNHPHITTLYDIGQQDGIDFLVMEYLEGETLADRLKKGGLPIDQALRYGIELSDALDKAHRQGVVHRDVKPGNVMLMKSGTKLFDFGLAKVGERVTQAASLVSERPTEAKPLTEKGALLGTFQYMAPEQLEGEDADARTDIFALGVVLYEMLTGQRAFEGKSQASLMAAILQSEPPPVSSLSPMTPPALDRLVKKCLAKDPDGRWQSAGDLSDELKWLGEQGGAHSAARPGVGARRTWAAWVGTAAVAALLGGLVTWGLSRGARPAVSVTRLTMTLQPSEAFVETHHAANLALSPDGTRLVYVGRDGDSVRLYDRPLDRLEVKAIPGTEDARGPFFSPDGEWLGFFALGKLKKLSLKGGAVQVICDVPSGHGGIWGPDDTILFSMSHTSGLSRVSAGGGVPDTLTTPRPGTAEAHAWPSFLPDGKGVLFSIVDTDDFENARIAFLSLESREQKTIIKEAFFPHVLATGHLLYARADGMAVVPFDSKRLEVAGPAVPVVAGLRRDEVGVPQVSFSKTGTIAFVADDLARHERDLVWVDRRGNVRPVEAPRRDWLQPRLSPDGKRLAASIDRLHPDVWILDLERSALTRLTFDGGNLFPTWTPDGRRIVFRGRSQGAGNLSWIAADGSGRREQLLSFGAARWPGSWSPDGRSFAFMAYEPASLLDIYLLSADSKEVREFLKTRFYEAEPAFSPDGKWMAYASNKSGRYEVFVRSLSGSSEIQVSTEGGQYHVWRRDGRELFYRSGNKTMAVPIQGGAELRAGKPQLLFESAMSEGSRPVDRNYDVTPDGQSFLMTRSGAAESPPVEIRVVLNWQPRSRP